MRLDIKWNKTTYNQFLEYLNSLSDLEYKKFSSVINICDNLIGVRMPILKKIAKEISKYDYQSFIKYNTHKTHEETLIHGLII